MNMHEIFIVLFSIISYFVVCSMSDVTHCWSWPKRTGGQMSKCLKFCTGIKILNRFSVKKWASVDMKWGGGSIPTPAIPALWRIGVKMEVANLYKFIKTVQNHPLIKYARRLYRSLNVPIQYAAVICVLHVLTPEKRWWFCRALCRCCVTYTPLHYCTVCRLDKCHVDCKTVITAELAFASVKQLSDWTDS